MLIAVSAMLFLLPVEKLSADAERIDGQIGNEANIMVRFVPSIILRSNETNENVKAIIVEEEIENQRFATSEELVYSAIIKFPVVSQARNATTEIKENASVKATLRLEYDFNRQTEKIKFINLSGGWEPMPGYAMEFHNAKIWGRDGVPLGNGFNIEVLNQTYNYSPGWSYVDFYPVSDISGISAGSEVIAKLSNMGGYTITIQMNPEIV